MAILKIRAGGGGCGISDSDLNCGCLAITTKRCMLASPRNRELGDEEGWEEVNTVGLEEDLRWRNDSGICSILPREEDSLTMETSSSSPRPVGKTVEQFDRFIIFVGGKCARFLYLYEFLRQPRVSELCV